MKLKNVFESINKDKVLYADEWLSLRQTGGRYTYMHEEKSDGKAVAVLGFKTEEDGSYKILGRFEEVPPHHDGISLCALTGMVEKGDEPLETAVRELSEEAGIEADQDQFENFGTTRPSKASDTTMFLFAVDLSDIEEKEIYSGEGDGTKGEEGLIVSGFP